MGSEKVVIHLIIYSDATQLNAFGTQKAWTVYLWLGNIPKRIRRSRQKGRAVLLGYLPKVTHICFIFHKY